MQILGSGQFKVQSGERIAVTITKSVSPYSAQVSDLLNATWNPKPDDNGSLTAKGGFTSPQAGGTVTSFGILFNFVPSTSSDDQDDSGDFYTVTIAGSGGDPFTQMIFAPGFTSRTYRFEVAQ